MQKELSDKLDRILKHEKIIGRLFFLLFVFIILDWIRQFDVLPIQDLPNHIANCHIFLNYHQSAFFQDNFSLNLFIYPYWVQDILLSLLMLFDVDFAAKTFALLTLLSLPVGLYVYLRKTQPDKTHLIFYTFPLMWNKLFLKGNFNFILGLALAFVCLAFVHQILFLRHDKKTIWALAAWTCTLYFTHLIVFLLFLFLASISIAYWTIRNRVNKLPPGFLGFLY